VKYLFAKVNTLKINSVTQYSNKVTIFILNNYVYEKRFKTETAPFKELFVL